MEFWGRVIAGGLLVYMTFSGFTYLGIRQRGLAPAGPVAPQHTVFSGEGALTYYREGDGHTDPYLIYRGSDGTIATKIVSLSEASVCGSESCPKSLEAFERAYGPGPVAVTGVVKHEELVVSSLRRTAGALPGFALASLTQGSSTPVFSYELSQLAYAPDGRLVSLAGASTTERFLLEPGTLVNTHYGFYLSYAIAGAPLVIAVKQGP